MESGDFECVHVSVRERCLLRGRNGWVKKRYNGKGGFRPVMPPDLTRNSSAAFTAQESASLPVEALLRYTVIKGKIMNFFINFY